MPKISIIMPIYNGKDYLDESINSVLEQSFKDFELICINDSSTDNSKEIVENFSKKDNRIKCFTKENGGPAAALNYGVQKAQGEFLCFIDQDDKYAPCYLEKMLDLITSTGCEVGVCNAYFWEDDKLTRVPYPETKEKKNILDISTPKKKKFFSNAHFPQWIKIVKKEFWLKNNIEFPSRENKAHDVPVHYQIIGTIKKIGYLEDCLYLHRFHQNQISYGFDDAFYCYMSAVDVFKWLKTNKANKNNIKQFLKYLIRHSANLTNKIELVDKLISLTKENYHFLNCIGLLHKLYKKRKRLKKSSILNLPKIQNAIVGKNSYCASQPFVASPKTTIGNFVSIGENVRIGHGKHPINFLSTSPYFYFDNLGWKTNQTPSHNEFWNYEPVNIGNDVWIGDNVLIKNGIKIGDGAVIGMGSVVTKDVPPYAVVGGVPAKIIKYRFDEETIKKLLELKWWNLDDEELKKLNYDNPDETIKELENLKSLHS